jgi:hypothetical protein
MIEADFSDPNAMNMD